MDDISSNLLLVNNVDLLFPTRAIEPLRKLRGEDWGKLIESVMQADPTSTDRLGFVLFMVRINGCTTCQSDSFRAMRGCIACSSNTIRRFKGNDQDLLDQFYNAKKDIAKHLKEE